MNLAVLGQIGSFAKEAVTSNFWGLGCPSYCQGSSIFGLLTAYLLGLLSGFCFLLAIWIWILAFTPPHSPDSSSPVLLVHQTAAQLRSRLWGYRQVVDEQS